MTIIDVEPSIIAEYEAPAGNGFDETQLAAASFLAHYSGRTFSFCSADAATGSPNRSPCTIGCCGAEKRECWHHGCAARLCG